MNHALLITIKELHNKFKDENNTTFCRIPCQGVDCDNCPVGWPDSEYVPNLVKFIEQSESETE